jgi:RNA polymerase sigma factor for flagellar operon FliA
VSRLAAYSGNEAESADALVREYLPLVKKIALRLAVKLPSEIELDDLMQVGLMGLLRARDSYDAAQGASFATYAGIRIKGAMLDELRGNDWLPRSVQEQFSSVAAAIERLDARFGRPPRDAEIAEEMGMALADYQALAGRLACARMTPLDEADEPGGISATVAADETFREVGDAGFREALAGAVTRLPEKEQLMMSLYYSEGLNLKEIGAVLGVSESRVSQLHGQALARLRVALRAWKG